jgi:hypothetical protein
MAVAEAFLDKRLVSYVQYPQVLSMATADTAFAKARQVFSEHRGMLRTSKAMRLGIHPRTLYALRDAGDIARSIASRKSCARTLRLLL